MNFPFEKTVTTEEEMKAVAYSFGKILVAGDLVCFNGDLGTGKTFFVKSVCEIFGLDNVTSPTFSIVNVYQNEISKRAADIAS